MDKYKIEICEHTKKEIIKIQEPNGNWICLHKENEMLDEVSVSAFKAGQDFTSKE